MPPLTLKTDHIYIGDVLQKLKLIPGNSVRCCITSPPYYLMRNYGGWVNNVCWGNFNDFVLPKKGNKLKYFRIRLQVRAANNQIVYSPKKQTYICAYGMEPSLKMYVKHTLLIFKEIRRVLTDDGTIWLNLGDSYSQSTMTKHGGERKNRDQRAMSGLKRKLKSTNLKPKDLIGIPWTVAFALRDKLGFYLRSDIIWHKPNPMPESVTDRPTKAHEYIFLLTKSAKYYYDDVAIRHPLAESVLKDKRLYDENYTTGRPERNFPGQSSHGAGLLSRKSGNIERKYGDAVGSPEYNNKHQGRSVPWEGMTANKKSVWTVSTKPFSDAHFATFPEDLIVDCIKAGTSEHGQCSQCGKPWVRITEKELKPTYDAAHNTKANKRDYAADANDQASNRVKDGHMPGHYNEYTTTGWRPTCKCKKSPHPLKGREADTPLGDGGSQAVIPDIVLDPFAGAATTLLVGKKLHRQVIGIELNPKYVNDIAVPRLQKELGMFYTITVDQ